MKDSGNKLNLSFDMLVWLKTNPLTIEQKRLSRELNSAATPFIVKKLYSISGISREKKEFERIAKDHAKSLYWMEFASNKDHRKIRRLEKEKDKYKNLYLIEKEEKDAAKRAQRQAEKETKKAQEQKEKAEEERDHFELSLSQNLDYSSEKENVEIYSADGSKQSQNIICTLNFKEKRSLYSSKSYFPNYYKINI
jgi:hypothetical protein